MLILKTCLFKYVYKNNMFMLFPYDKGRKILNLLSRSLKIGFVE